VLDPPGVHDGAARPQFPPQRPRQGRDDADVLFFADSPPGGDDDVGPGQVDVFGLGRLVADEFEGGGPGGFTGVTVGVPPGWSAGKAPAWMVRTVFAVAGATLRRILPLQQPTS
jgi:hypothetical protein